MISSLTVRVNYSETDQMGVVYHANYLIWFDRARTELMRDTGLSYKELEQQGVYLAVAEVSVRYRAPARYDDLVQVRCWVRELASRRVTFGYAVDRAATGELLATGQTALVSLTHAHAITRIPAHVLDLLHPVPDPVRL
ncbi:MAG TPA: thioesterase family protein [Gemmatimonadales bacterium]|nr:thioesterase family protein [Gemmatimonadales bacterium]